VTEGTSKKKKKPVWGDQFRRKIGKESLVEETGKV